MDATFSKLPYEDYPKHACFICRIFFLLKYFQSHVYKQKETKESDILYQFSLSRFLLPFHIFP